MKNKIVTVFGGSGFLGSHVADYLTSIGYRVRIFDNCESKYLQDTQEMILGDILNFDQVQKATKGCDIVYNFAGLADLDEVRDRPIDSVKFNVLGNVNLLEAARLENVNRFVYASSIYVFSNAGSFYRASKHASELYVEVYQKRYGLNYTILRYGTLYGRRSDYRNSVYRFIHEALTKGSITYHGDPNAQREYIHVEDAAKLSTDILSEAYVNRNIILTGQEKMPVKNLLQIICEILPESISCQFVENHSSSHYVMTPYAFNHRIGHKLVSNDFVDIGQGLLDCISEAFEEISSKQELEVNLDEA